MAEQEQSVEREYRKTATIRARQWWKIGDHPAVMMCSDVTEAMKVGHAVPWLDGLEGGHVVTPGDWIATGIQGENWPIKPDVFAATYAPVEQEAGRHADGPSSMSDRSWPDCLDPNAAHNRRPNQTAPDKALAEACAILDLVANYATPNDQAADAALIKLSKLNGDVVAELSRRLSALPNQTAPDKALSIEAAIRAYMEKAGVPTTEFDPAFATKMVAAMMVSFHKYGKVADAYPLKFDAVSDIRARLTKYRQTGNKHYLVDAANFAMIEAMHPAPERNAEWAGNDAADSPGRTTASGHRLVQEDNAGNRIMGIET